MSSLNKRKEVIPLKSLTLALNSAEGRLQIVLGIPGGDSSPAQLLLAQDFTARAQGVEILMPAIKAAFATLSLSKEQLGRIAVVSGPGSFTGLRLAAVSAAALSRALQIPMAGVPYLPLLALNAVPFVGSGMGKAQVSVITHARRGLVYYQLFEINKAKPTPVTEVQVLEATACKAKLLQNNAPCFVLGSGLVNNPEFFADLEAENITLLPPTLNAPLPEYFLDAVGGLTYSMEDITPLYLRRSDAEENLPHIATRLGLNATEAKERLEELLRS